MRSKDGEEEVPCRTYENFASRDQLSAVVLETTNNLETR
jgi:hypothetical protein